MKRVFKFMLTTLACMVLFAMPVFASEDDVTQFIEREPMRGEILAVADTKYDYNGTVLDDFREIGNYEKYKAEGYVYWYMWTSSDTKRPLVMGVKDECYINSMGALLSPVSGQYAWFSVQSSGAWRDNGYGTLNTTVVANADEKLVWTSHDLKDEDGNVFMEGDLVFQGAPLEVIIQAVTGEQMKVMIPNLVGTMKILVLCGVGLMALLVVLKLFGKRSLIYRN